MQMVEGMGIHGRFRQAVVLLLITVLLVFEAVSFCSAVQSFELRSEGAPAVLSAVDLQKLSPVSRPMELLIRPDFHDATHISKDLLGHFGAAVFSSACLRFAALFGRMISGEVCEITGILHQRILRFILWSDGKDRICFPVYGQTPDACS